jgi:hypothetical protein
VNPPDWAGRSSGAGAHTGPLPTQHRKKKSPPTSEPHSSPPYAANRLSFGSATTAAAGLARPFAQFLSPAICSAIVFDNGTNSVKTLAIAKSVGSSPSSNAWYRASTKTASISLPVNPSVPLASCAVLNSLGRAFGASRCCRCSEPPLSRICRFSKFTDNFGMLGRALGALK